MATPRFTITLTDNLLKKSMSIGSPELKAFKAKTIMGKSSIYELLDAFEVVIIKAGGAK